MLYVNPMESFQGARMDTAQSETIREKQALQEFERLFLYTLLKEMRKSVPEDGLLDSGSSTRVYWDMLDDAMAGEMARSGQLGVANAMEAQLKLNRGDGSKENLALGRYKGVAL